MYNIYIYITRKLSIYTTDHITYVLYVLLYLHGRYCSCFMLVCVQLATVLVFVCISVFNVCCMCFASCICFMCVLFPFRTAVCCYICYLCHGMQHVVSICLLIIVDAARLHYTFYFHLCSLYRGYGRVVAGWFYPPYTSTPHTHRRHRRKKNQTSKKKEDGTSTTHNLHTTHTPHNTHVDDM